MAKALADPNSAFVLHPSASPRKGADSCDVARQWCGRLVKVENCQAGILLVSPASTSR
jgi:SRSO17 transposase